MKTLFKNTALATAFTLSTLALPLNAQANTPTDSSVQQLMQVMHMQANTKKMLASENDMIERMIQMQLAQTGVKLTPSQQQQVGQIISKHISSVLTENEPKLNQLMQQGFVAAAKQYYSQEEVNAQIEFYNSKVGQSILEKQPEMMNSYLQNTMPQVMQIMSEQMQQTMPAMIKELQAVVPELKQKPSTTK